MSLQTLSLATLGDLDRGAAGVAINHAIKTAIADTVDRGKEDGKARKVTITLEITSNPRGDIFDLGIDVKTTLPALRTSTTQASERYVEGKSHLLFQAESNRADQPSLPLDGNAE